MTSFDFDQPPSPGTNRAAPPTDCPTCGGHRLVQVFEKGGVTDREVYARCPACNAGPHAAREAQPDAWWKQ